VPAGPDLRADGEPAPRAAVAPGGWCVAATVRGRREYMHDFIEYYLSIGATQVFLFIDDPAARVQDPPGQDRRVVRIGCDADYWRTTSGRRPDDLNERQLANLRTSRAEARGRWLLNVDLDERVHCPTLIGPALEAQPDDVDAIALPPLEALYDAMPTIATAFRTPWFKRILTENDLNRPETTRILTLLHRDMAPLARGGLFGHVRGKYFVRTDRPDLALHIHKVTARKRRAVTTTLPGWELLHYDALTFLDWREKWALRISGETLCAMGAPRLSQFRLIREAQETGDPGALREIYRTLYVAQPSALGAALAAGVVVARPGAARASPASLASGEDSDLDGAASNHPALET
jgi:hypothetical protein